MEEKTICNSRVHHGHNIRHFRMQKGIKQEAMAELVNVSQQTVSRYESMREIDDDMLLRFAKALEVKPEDLKTREEEGNTYIVENNNIETNNGVGYIADNEYCTNNFDPIEKMAELYERLLQAEKDRSQSLEQRIAVLEQKLSGK